MSNDPTEPRWACSNGHSNPATADSCRFPGCGA